MKTRLHYILDTLILAILCLAMDSCDVHEFPIEEPAPKPEPPTIVVEPQLCLNVTVPLQLEGMPFYKEIFYDVENDMTSEMSRSAIDDGMQLRFLIDVFRTDTRGYNRGESTPDFRIVHTAPEIKEHMDIPLKLDAGKYELQIWADYVPKGTTADYFYDVHNMNAITVPEIEKAGDCYHPGNERYRDCFVGHTSMAVPSAEQLASNRADSIVVVEARADLERPLALFAIETNDIRKFVEEKVKQMMNIETLDDPSKVMQYTHEVLSHYTVMISYTGYMPYMFNAGTNKPVDSATGRCFFGKMEVLDTDHAVMGFDQVFVNGSESGVDIAIDVYDDTGTKVSAIGPLKVPLKRGRYTLVTGRFLSADASGGVGINPGFNGDYNVQIF